jgi:tetratricopeptide (TPR) repeat protein
VACRPDGSQFATTGADEGRVWITEVPSPEVRREKRLRGRVHELFNRFHNRESVVQSLGADPALNDRDRAEALRLATELPKDAIPTNPSLGANLLNEMSWAIVVGRNRAPEEYLRALRFAELACQSSPNDPTFLNTLGVARYRAGQYSAAVADLGRSLILNTNKLGGPLPADLAFLALAQHRAGESTKAKENLERLRGLMKQPGWAKDAEARALLREAETIDLDLAFPAEPFAP